MNSIALVYCTLSRIRMLWGPGNGFMEGSWDENEWYAVKKNCQHTMLLTTKLYQHPGSHSCETNAQCFLSRRCLQFSNQSRVIARPFALYQYWLLVRHGIRGRDRVGIAGNTVEVFLNFLCLFYFTISFDHAKRAWQEFPK
jgi:hypothetical protein